MESPDAKWSSFLPWYITPWLFPFSIIALCRKPTWRTPPRVKLSLKIYLQHYSPLHLGKPTKDSKAAKLPLKNILFSGIYVSTKSNFAHRWSEMNVSELQISRHFTKIRGLPASANGAVGERGNIYRRNKNSFTEMKRRLTSISGHQLKHILLRRVQRPEVATVQLREVHICSTKISNFWLGNLQEHSGYLWWTSL